MLNSFIEFFTLADAAATARVSERLALVLSAPKAYQEKYAAELADRGVTGELQEEKPSGVAWITHQLFAKGTQLPVQELRDVALIDALLAEDLVWESDWSETAAEIADGLNEVLVEQNAERLLQPDAWPKRGQPGPEQLDAVQDALEPLGLALVLFTLDSDSYPLGVVADARAEEVRRRAQELGFKLVVY